MAAPVGEWYVLFCKPRREKQVCSVLDAKGFENFFPTHPVRTDRSRTPQIQPFFPRYLFVQADIQEIGTLSLDWIPGAVGLVKFGDKPAAVPSHVIEQLKQRLAEIHARGGLQRCEFKPGQAVRIVHGPLSGYDALFDTQLSGSQRVRVLLRLLGRQVKVTISSNAIEARHTLNA